MRLFSDFRIFERPPKPSFALVRWMAWRFLLLGAVLSCFLAYFYATYVAGGELLFYTNENRYLTRSETIELFWLFFSGWIPFLILGLLGVLFVPKR